MLCILFSFISCHLSSAPVWSVCVCEALSLLLYALDLSCIQMVERSTVGFPHNCILKCWLSKRSKLKLQLQRTKKRICTVRHVKYVTDLYVCSLRLFTVWSDVAHFVRWTLDEIWLILATARWDEECVNPTSSVGRDGYRNPVFNRSRG